jgi:hypothetical protein
MLHHPRVILLVSVLMFLALEGTVASRSKEEMLQDLARRRASATQPRLIAPLGSFNRRTMAVHERVGATAALRENTRENVKQRTDALNTTRRAASPAGHPSMQDVLGRELLQIDLFVPPPP